MDSELPLATLLSQAFVAFTIEADNEFERRVAHRTARHGSTGSRREVPWLTSMVMWFTCLRFVDGEDRSIREVERLARASTNWDGLERWGYIDVAPDPADPRPRPPRRDWLVQATPAGRRAQDAWRPLSDEIEERWAERFGRGQVDELRERLATVVGQLDPELPDCLPILGYGLFNWLPAGPASAALDDPGRAVGRIALPSLLAKVLLALALEFEDRWPVSLASSSDVLRVLDEPSQRLRDLPGRSGVSKESISMALGVLVKAGLVELGPSPAEGRGKVVRLTARGLAAQVANASRLASLEARWPARFGVDAIAGLRSSLEPLVGAADGGSPLWAGLAPYPDGWRAAVPRPDTLPHFPMVLHRGGYPDGS